MTQFAILDKQYNKELKSFNTQVTTRRSQIQAEAQKAKAGLKERPSKVIKLPTLTGGLTSGIKVVRSDIRAQQLAIANIERWEREELQKLTSAHLKAQEDLKQAKKHAEIETEEAERRGLAEAKSYIPDNMVKLSDGKLVSKSEFNKLSIKQQALLRAVGVDKFNETNIITAKRERPTLLRKQFEDDLKSGKISAGSTFVGITDEGYTYSTPSLPMKQKIPLRPREQFKEDLKSGKIPLGSTFAGSTTEGYTYYLPPLPAREQFDNDLKSGDIPAGSIFTGTSGAGYSYVPKDSVKLKNNEYISKSDYDKLSSDEKHNLNSLGLKDFNILMDFRRDFYIENTVEIKTGERVPKSNYDNMTDEEKHNLNSLGVEKYNILVEIKDENAIKLAEKQDKAIEKISEFKVDTLEVAGPGRSQTGAGYNLVKAMEQGVTYQTLSDAGFAPSDIRYAQDIAIKPEEKTSLVLSEDKPEKHPLVSFKEELTPWDESKGESYRSFEAGLVKDLITDVKAWPQRFGTGRTRTQEELKARYNSLSGFAQFTQDVIGKDVWYDKDTDTYYDTSSGFGSLGANNKLGAYVFEFITPWREDKGETYWDMVKTSIAGKETRTQEELKATYESELNSLKIIDVLFGKSVVYNKETDTYHGISIGYGPIIGGNVPLQTRVPKFGPATVSKALDKVDDVLIAADKAELDLLMQKLPPRVPKFRPTMGAKDVDMSEDMFARFIKARVANPGLEASLFKAMEKADGVGIFNKVKPSVVKSIIDKVDEAAALAAKQAEAARIADVSARWPSVKQKWIDQMAAVVAKQPKTSSSSLASVGSLTASAAASTKGMTYYPRLQEVFRRITPVLSKLNTLATQTTGLAVSTAPAGQVASTVTLGSVTSAAALFSRLGITLKQQAGTQTLSTEQLTQLSKITNIPIQVLTTASRVGELQQLVQERIQQVQQQLQQTTKLQEARQQIQPVTQTQQELQQQLQKQEQVQQVTQIQQQLQQVQQQQLQQSLGTSMFLMPAPATLAIPELAPAPVFSPTTFPIPVPTPVTTTTPTPAPTPPQGSTRTRIDTPKNLPLLGFSKKKLLAGESRVIIKATLDGKEYKGNVVSRLSGSTARQHVDQTPAIIDDAGPGIYTLLYISGKPISSTYKSIKPTSTKLLKRGGQITFIIAFESIKVKGKEKPEEKRTIFRDIMGLTPALHVTLPIVESFNKAIGILSGGIETDIVATPFGTKQRKVISKARPHVIGRSEYTFPSDERIAALKAKYQAHKDVYSFEKQEYARGINI